MVSWQLAAAEAAQKQAERASKQLAEAQKQLLDQGRASVFSKGGQGKGQGQPVSKRAIKTNEWFNKVAQSAQNSNGAKTSDRRADQTPAWRNRCQFH